MPDFINGQIILFIFIAARSAGQSISGTLNLVIDPWDYYYPSAWYHERDENNFDFLKDVREEF